MNKFYRIRSIKPSYFKNRAIYRAYPSPEGIYLFLCTATSLKSYEAFPNMISLLKHICPDGAAELFNMICTPGFQGLHFDSWKVILTDKGDFIYDWD